MKKGLFWLLLLTLTGTVRAQDTGYDPLENEDENRYSEFNSPRERYYLGGDLNLWYSTGGGVINLSPMFGYKITRGLMLGTGLTYQYTSGYDIYGGHFTNNLFGWRAVVRQDLFRFLFANAEFETYYTRVYDWVTNREMNRAIPVGNVGLGFKRMFSDHSYYQILLQYDLIGDRFTQYYVYPIAPFSLKLGFMFCLDDF